MADPAPSPLVQISPKSAKKDGFNLVTENVIVVNLEARQLEVELLAYDGKTVLLDVAEDALDGLQKIKPGDGATLRIVEEDGKRLVKQFSHSGERSQRRQSRCRVAGFERYTLAQSQNMPLRCWESSKQPMPWMTSSYVWKMRWATSGIEPMKP